MTPRLPRDNGPDPAAILATSFVIVGGLAACSAIIFSSSTDPRVPLLILVGGVLGYGLLYWLLGPKRSDLVGSLFWFRRPRRKQKLQLRLHRFQPGTQECEPAGPPSAESIRALKEHHNVWVRSKDRPCANDAGPG